MKAKKRSVALYPALGLLLFAYLWFFGPLRYFPGPSPLATANALRAALPLGTNVETVLAYLDSQHLEHSSYVRKSQTVVAIKRDTCHMILVQCDTEIALSFDEQRRLAAIHVKPGFTGL